MRTIKQRLFLGSFLAVTIAATIGNSVYAYNTLLFAIPVLFVITMLIFFSESVREKCVETVKVESSGSTINTKESCMWNLPIVFLLAAFGHWLLALLWLVSWGTLLGLKLDAIEKKEKV